MQKNPICWWEIGVKDAKKSIDFFKAAFEWDIEYEEKTDYHAVSAGDGGNGFFGGGIFPLRDKDSDNPYLTIYLTVEDVDAQVKIVKEAGGEIIDQPFDVEGVGRICMFREPSGQMLGMIQHAKKE